MRISRLFVTAASLLLAATAFAQRVTYDFDTSADFARFKTYAFAGGTALGDPLNDERIVSAIKAQLEAKGLAEVELDARPDLIIARHALMHRTMQIRGRSSGLRYAGTASGSAKVEPSLAWSLGIEMFETDRRALVWRSIARQDYDASASPEKREKKIDRTVRKLLEHYPVQS